MLNGAAFISGIKTGMEKAKLEKEDKMNKREKIIIECVENGFIVSSPADDFGAVYIKGRLVFQDMGYASAARDSQRTEDTLLGFIEEHFREEVLQSKK